MPVQRLSALALPAVLSLGLALGLGPVGAGPVSAGPADTGTAPRAASPTTDDLPAGSVVADERITDLVRAGDRVYVRGHFGTVGRYAGPGAVLDGATGAPAPGPAIADGQVSVTVADGAGGWYVGGDFTRIGGHRAGGLAHVLADGTLDTDFLPVADGLV
ncbi:MAG TPA: delta-60 repeat domain-containing protein, partial [Nocardioides sp.]|nr:delta-60 repeat domain-containing protein [Nocardioides sp.]